MGLDMYLTKRTYIGSEYEHRNVVVKNIDITIDGKEVKINPKRIQAITESVGYWRKANHIHRWFVENIQDGEDDCGEYNLTIEDLKSLLDDCIQVKNNHEFSENVLPTGEGFFFGSTDYDEYYYQNIDDTIKIIEDILSETEEDNYNVSFTYQSSW